MKELFWTNDPAENSWLTAVRAGRGIDAIVLDTHTIILEGQIGAIPRRIMVIDEDFEAARTFVNSAELAVTDTETVDGLLDGRVLLRQPKAGYRVAIDPVLLAASIEAGAGERVLDVGAGVGAAALCLASRCECAELFGLELQPELVELARSNAAESGLKVDFHQGVARSARPNCSRRVYSLWQPPYCRWSAPILGRARMANAYRRRRASPIGLISYLAWLRRTALSR